MNDQVVKMDCIKIKTKDSKFSTENYWENISQKNHVKIAIEVDKNYVNNLVFTDQNGNSTIRECVLNLIDNARKTIFASTWLINERNILERLINKSYNLEGGIYLLAPVNPKWDYFFYRDENDYLLSAHTKALKRLRPNLPIAVRGHPNAHFKLWIGDNKEMLISSANLRTTSFGNNIKPEEENSVLNDYEYIPTQPKGIPELGIHTTNTDMIQKSKEFYKLIWFNSKPIGYSEKYNIVSDHSIQIPKHCPTNTNISEQNSIHWTLNTKEENLSKYSDFSLEQQLGEMIEQDFDTINLATWSFTLPKSKFDIKNIQSLKRLKEIAESRKNKKSKLNIKILTKKINYKNFDSEYRLIKEIYRIFEGHNVELRIHDQNHSKFILFLKEELLVSGLLLTGNLLDGLIKGIECGYAIYDKRILEQMLTFFEYLWRGASSEWNVQKSLEVPIENQILNGNFQDTIRISVFDKACLILESEATISLNVLKNLIKRKTFQCYKDKQDTLYIISLKNEIGLRIRMIENSYYKLEEILQNEEMRGLRQNEISCPMKLELIWEDFD